MNVYNEIWTREKFVEYRKLKRSGYDHQMLKEHFGDDIYHSGFCKKEGVNVFSFKVFEIYNKLNEIKITPSETEYKSEPRFSDFIRGKFDYLIHFESNNIKYVICLMYFPINGIETYNIVFTTNEQWKEYLHQLNIYMNDGIGLNKDRNDELINIIGRVTKYNDLFPIFKKISYILTHFNDNHIKIPFISICDTKEDERKINLYRDIIKNSFTNLKETIEFIGDDKYFIYN